MILSPVIAWYVEVRNSRKSSRSFLAPLVSISSASREAKERKPPRVPRNSSAIDQRRRRIENGPACVRDEVNSASLRRRNRRKTSQPRAGKRENTH